MKAAVCYEFGKPLVVEEVVLAPPQAGEVLVKLAACAICHSDIHYMEGAWGGSLPAVYGHEAAGVVTAVGEGVVVTQPGDHVVVSLIRSCGRCFYCVQGQPMLCETQFALHKESRLAAADGRSIQQGIKVGGFAEQVVVHESQVVPIPHEIPLDSASLLACGVITGLGAVVNTAQMPAGSSAVIIGAGGVGLNSIQGARLSGAQPIVAIDLLPEKLKAAKEFGATHVLNPSEGDVKTAVLALTRGRGADYVFVTVGSGKAIEQGLTLIRRGGTFVMVGMPPSGVPLTVEATNFAFDNQRVLGSNMGSTRLQVDVPKLVELYLQERLKLDELVTGRYPLAQINEAIAEVNRGEALRNVIVF
ncbi:MAG: Zn-dependent alcohol dehydrogenase [Ardenticatenaceae bacterium]|nr:Zn-dependent alcohol dehydrogenase [Ardenticatenaceae bacterium]